VDALPRPKATATDPWSFSVACPEGHLTPQSAFDRTTLANRVRSRASIPLYCRICRRHWDATAQQRKILGLALENDARVTRASKRRSR
jgi:hypothetical protein